MRALMEYLGEEDLGCRVCRSLQPGCKVPCSYAFFIGVTGVASFLSWKPGWEGGNVEIMYMSDDPCAPFERAFQAAGYAYEMIGAGAGGADEVLLRRRIVESIRQARPVVAFGPIGPPEAALIIGYDEGGDVLIGWSFFQNVPAFNAGVDFESTGQFRKRDWSHYRDGFRCLLVGQKQERPTLAETYRRALEWMLQVTRTPVTLGVRHNGLAAYVAWAEHLLRDGDFPDDEVVLRQRHDVHDMAVGLVAEARWYGSQFLIQASNPDILHHSLAGDLLHAAACYAAEHDLMWQLWGLAGGNGNPEAFVRFADPAVRREMVPVIHEARQKDAQAAMHIERALARAT
jgi:hypothetical protein